MHLIPRMSVRRSLLVPLLGLALLLSACGGDVPLTATTVAPTNTVAAAAPTDPVAPTSASTTAPTTAPTDTVVPPTAMAVPPTAIPPTDTAVPPTVAPTNAPAPPTKALTAPTKVPTKRPTPVSVPTKAPTKAPAPAVVYVKVVDFAFDPPSITIPAGTKVIWTNIGPTEHTVADKDVNWSSNILNKNDAYSHVFTQPGTVTVICTLHPDMVSTVIVK
jgi:plastocyanin